MIHTNKIPTILGLILLIVGVFAGVFFLKSTQVFRIGADPTSAPKDVRMSNISDNSATISWTTDKESVGFISWGESESKLSNLERETQKDEKFTNHTISISGLKPSTQYFFKINSQGAFFDNNGLPWNVTTGPTLPAKIVPNIISGTVVDNAGNPSPRSIVYADIGGYLISTITSETGNFLLQIGSARSPDLQNYLSIIPSQTILDMSVVGPGHEISTIKIFPQSARPIPTIVLGENYDHRNLPPLNTGLIPDVDLSLPPEATQTSKFTGLTPGTKNKIVSVILESIDNGEVMSSTKPQFFGKGPPGTTITITINSNETITNSVKIGSGGSWSFTTPTNLSPGSHSISVSWVDGAGVTRTLTRTFIVQASEAPSFSASGSANQPTPTPTPTRTPTPSPTVRPTRSPTPSPTTAATKSPTPTPRPTATATLRPTITPRPTPTATVVPARLPESGDLTPTLILSIMGLSVIAFAFYIWKYARTIN